VRFVAPEPAARRIANPAEWLTSENEGFAAMPPVMRRQRRGSVIGCPHPSPQVVRDKTVAVAPDDIEDRIADEVRGDYESVDPENIHDTLAGEIGRDHGDDRSLDNGNREDDQQPILLDDRNGRIQGGHTVARGPRSRTEAAGRATRLTKEPQPCRERMARGRSLVSSESIGVGRVDTFGWWETTRAEHPQGHASLYLICNSTSAFSNPARLGYCDWWRLAFR